MRPESIRPSEPQGAPETPKQLGESFYVYTLAVLLNTAGLVPASLILFRASTVLQPEDLVWLVPIIYVTIQAVDGVVAPVSGLAFDKYGLKVLMVPFVFSVFPPLFLSSGAQLTELFVAAALFGLVLECRSQRIVRRFRSSRRLRPEEEPMEYSTQHMELPFLWRASCMGYSSTTTFRS